MTDNASPLVRLGAKKKLSPASILRRPRVVVCPSSISVKLHFGAVTKHLTVCFAVNRRIGVCFVLLCWTCFVWLDGLCCLFNGRSYS